MAAEMKCDGPEFWPASLQQKAVAQQEFSFANKQSLHLQKYPHTQPKLGGEQLVACKTRLMHCPLTTVGESFNLQLERALIAKRAACVYFFFKKEYQTTKVSQHISLKLGNSAVALNMNFECRNEIETVANSLRMVLWYLELQCA